MRTLLVTLMILSTGCATILQPGPDMVRVDSRPAGARVFVDGQPMCVTPCEIGLQRAGEGLIRIEKSGFEPVVIDRHKVFSGWVIGNLLVIGLVVDLATSNQGHYQETPVSVDLAPKPSMQSKAD